MKRLSLIAACAVLMAASSSNVRAGTECSGTSGCPQGASSSACPTNASSCPTANASNCSARPSGGGSGVSGTHTVVRGESLSRIAQSEYGNSQRWREIARANNLRSPYVIRVGQVLQLPDGSGRRSERTSVSSTDPNYNTNPGTLRELWVKPVHGGLPADNAPEGSELHREWNSRNNILATGVADRIGPPPTQQTVVTPAAPKPAPLGNAAPAPFGTGPVPQVVPVTSGNPVQNRPRP